MDQPHLPTLMTEVDEHCRRAARRRFDRHKGGQFMPRQKFFMPFLGGLLGTLVLGAALFGLVAGSGMRASGAPVSDFAPSTLASGSAVAAGAGTGTAKASTPHVTVPSAASAPPNSTAAPNPASGA